MAEATTTEPTKTYRLGDDIDDYCSHCQSLSTHAISAMIDGEVLKVVCRCLFEHKYRHAKTGRKLSKEAERQKLFDDVLKSSPFRPK